MSFLLGQYQMLKSSSIRTRTARSNWMSGWNEKRSG